MLLTSLINWWDLTPFFLPYIKGLIYSTYISIIACDTVHIILIELFGKIVNNFDVLPDQEIERS